MSKRIPCFHGSALNKLHRGKKRFKADANGVFLRGVGR